MEKLLTPSQVAEAMQVTERTVYRWLKDGDLKGIKKGRLWRIKESEFDRFLNDHDSSNNEE